MNIEDLKQYLNKEYQGSKSFLENVILPIFKNGFDDDDAKELLKPKSEYLKMADNVGVRSIKFLGRIYLGEPLQIYDITVADRVKMSRNRVGIQSIIRRMMDQYSNAFMIFHYEETTRWDWRFTFCHKSADKEETTDSKRYTFLLGPNQSCTTAAANFVKLYEKRGNIEIEDIERAFSVEALSDEFFDKYKGIYADIIQYVTGKRMVKVGGKWEEQKLGEPDEYIMQQFANFADPEKAVRDYLKKLMGRLVFLQFLQKKGWLGVPLNEDWGNGDHEFIQNLFANTKDKDNFVDGVLEVLFDDLNTERKDDVSQLSIFNYQLRIPYLNGGLFERDATDETNFPLPAKYMESMLDFFSQYNFTIDENDPNDAEVGVDPEMLGRIFENLLEDNKDKGAFYTPKEIVQYMCRESLIAYLQTDQNEEYKESIRQFVTTHNAEILGGIKEDIDKKLQDVKICDPAIGSGAFPMGLLKELYLCRSAIESIHEDKASEIKKHIIQHNIYGVDIEKGAVDIARLRFWLSLIVDEKTPHALPNLDFKIMQGNSLLEQYDGVDLSVLMLEEDNNDENNLQVTFFDDEFYKEKQELQALLNEYYECPDHKEKQALRKKISETIKKQIRERGLSLDFGNLDLSGNDQFFLWRTWFHDVFSRGGFDIVIGNPPYIEAKKLKYIASTLKGIYKVYSGTADFSIYFNELGLNLLANNGILSFITTNKFFNTGYGEKVREQLSSFNINILLNFEQVEVFENVLVSSVIFNISKTAMKQDNQFTYEKFYKLKCDEFKREFVIRQSDFGSYPQTYLGAREWSFADLIQLQLMEKIEGEKDILKNLDGVFVYRGVTTGYNPAFIITDEQRDQLISKAPQSSEVIKNMLQGRNIRKWYYNESDENLIFTRRGVNINLYPQIKNYLFSFYDNLKPKKKSTDEYGRKPGSYEWYEILDNTAYYPHFEKEEKIIWGLTADKWAYTLDTEQHYLPSNAYILTSKTIPIRYILGLLNSKLLCYYFSFIGVMTAGGAYTLKAATIEALPIAIGSKEIQNLISLKVDSILKAKRNNKQADVSSIEDEIDKLVYQLYGLTEDEINIIEQAVK